MTAYQWICALGVPTIIVALCTAFVKQLQHNNREMEALKAGMQALLRNQMIQDYNRYSEKGYAPIYAKESFENCWKQYHLLGANGVINNLHDKFLQLPDSPIKDKDYE